MFLLLTFFLANQVKACVTIQNFVNLRFKYSTYFLFSNGQFYIPKCILNIQIKNSEKVKLWTSHVPFFVHLNAHSPIRLRSQKCNFQKRMSSYQPHPLVHWLIWLPMYWQWLRKSFWTKELRKNYLL
jgi:hypothetical protein